MLVKNLVVNLVLNVVLILLFNVRAEYGGESCAGCGAQTVAKSWCGNGR